MRGMAQGSGVMSRAQMVLLFPTPKWKCMIHYGQISPLIIFMLLSLCMRLAIISVSGLGNPQDVITILANIRGSLHTGSMEIIKVSWTIGTPIQSWIIPMDRMGKGILMIGHISILPILNSPLHPRFWAWNQNICLWFNIFLCYLETTQGTYQKICSTHKKRGILLSTPIPFYCHGSYQNKGCIIFFDSFSDYSCAIPLCAPYR